MDQKTHISLTINHPNETQEQDYRKIFFKAKIDMEKLSLRAKRSSLIIEQCISVEIASHPSGARKDRWVKGINL